MENRDGGTARSPAHPGQQTYICPIMGRVSIGMVRCQELCRQPRTNATKCSMIACRSPFRLCKNCVVTGEKQPRLVSNPDSGLCGECGKTAAGKALGIPVPQREEAPVIPIRRSTDEIKPRPAAAIARLKEDLLVVTADMDPATLTGREVFVPTSLIDHLPGQPRKDFEEGEMMSLTMSIKEDGQLVAGEVTPFEGRYMLTDGERRLRACKRLRIPFKTVVKPFMSYAMKKWRSIAMNFNRRPHNPIETALAIGDMRQIIRDDNKAQGIEQSENKVRLRIVATLGYDISSVGNYLKLLDQLDPRVIELMMPSPHRKTLRSQIALELTRFFEKPDLQFELARHMVAKDMKYQEGRNFLAAQGRTANIAKGRGAERKPADRRDILETALLRIGPILMDTLELSEYEFRRMFERKDPSKFRDLFRLAKERRDQFQELVDHLEAVEESFVPLSDEETLAAAVE